MFADELRRAVEGAARVELPAVSVLLWKAFGAGQVTEAEAEGLANLIEVKALQTAARPPLRKPVGARPRTDASLERRRRWAASGRLPPNIASHFTTAEVAVLAVIAVEVAKGADCTLAIGHIAGLAGVGETSVRRALHAAKALGLITVEERRVSAFRNLTNVVRIVSREWQAWIRLPRSGGGFQGRQGSNTKILDHTKKGSGAPKRSCREVKPRVALQEAPAAVSMRALSKHLLAHQGRYKRSNAALRAPCSCLHAI